MTGGYILLFMRRIKSHEDKDVGWNDHVRDGFPAVFLPSFLHEECHIHATWSEAINALDSKNNGITFRKVNTMSRYVFLI